MNDRVPLDHLTSDQLDALYDRAEQAEAAIARVRRLCALTINQSIRTEAIHQARDTLAALDLPGSPAAPATARRTTS